MICHDLDYTFDEIIVLLEPCIGMTLGETDRIGLFEHYKDNPKVTGIAGHVLQQAILGQPQDSRQEADIFVDGVPVEVKATGVRPSKQERGKYDAKEPMSITGVSVDEIVNQEFFDSFFWHKVARLLIAYYLYDSDVTVTAPEYADFTWMDWELHRFSEDEIEILRHDWTLVRDFIRMIQDAYDYPEDGYPRLSSELRSELMFIDTAPKWPHKPRFRLKRSVVSAMARRCFEQRELESVSIWSMNDIDRRCHIMMRKYAGRTIGELAAILDVRVNPDSKQVAEAIVTRMFGADSKKMSKVEPFASAGIDLKSVTLSRDGFRTEDTKLCRVDFDEVLDPDFEFEDSTFYSQFAERQMLFAIFEEPDHDAPLRENTFLGFKRISFSDDFIEDEVFPVWDEMRYTIFTGQLVDVVERARDGSVRLSPKTGLPVSAPNFPKASDHDVFLRGTGTDARSKTLVIDGVRMYRQWNIWIKGVVLCDALSELPFL